MSNWVTVEIPRNANDPNSISIGYAIFDLDLPQPDGSTFLDPNYHNFVALVSTFDPRDTDFSGDVGFLEGLASKLLPGNLADTRFTQYAYEYLNQYTPDNSGFGSLADGALISMMADLIEDGVEQTFSKPAFGIAKSFAKLFAQNIGKPALEAYIDTLDDDEYVPQFFIKPEHEALVEAYMGSFDQDATPTDFDIDFVYNSGFSYSSNTNYFVSASDGEDFSANASDGNDVLLGADGNDNLSGGNGYDVLSGGSGNDALNAGAGDDYVDGGDGDDTIRAGAGKDTIEGGTGTDLLHYDRRDLSDGEVISLDLPSGAAFTLSDGSEVSGIEQIHLSLGGGENDVSLVANGDKNNSVNVASDTDIDHFAVDFSSFTEGVDWFHRGSSSSNQFAGALTSDGDNYLVNTYNFERFTVIGSSANDRLNGRNNNDRLEGRDGNDALNAGAGDDYVDGGDGDDTIRAGAGKDTIEGGTGTDLLHYDRRDLSDGEVISLDLPSGAAFTLSDGSEVSGIEQIHLSLGGGENDVSLVANGDKNNSVNVASDTDIDHFAVDFSSFTEGVDWFHRGSSSSNQFAGALTSDGDNYLVNTYNFERFTVIGSSANDRLNGRNNNDRLEGRDGNDALNAGAGDDYVDGGDGDDTIRAGAGKDTIEGGTGTDLLHYDRRDLSDGEVISLDLPSGAAFTLSDGSEVSGIEQIHLSLGGGENDVSLVANGDKNNSVNVASDTDIDHFAVDFSSFTEGVDWFHRGSSSSNQFAGALTSDGDNYLVNTYNFERFTVIGSSANDRLNGRNNNDRLEGRDGNDALNAGAGDDYVDGGDGDDTIRAGAGKDTIEGGTGTDLLHYDRRDLSDGEVISLDLPSGAAFTLSDGSEVSGIEQIHLSLGGGENDVSLVANGDKNNSVNVASDTDIDHFAVDFSSFTEGVDWFHRGSSSSNQFAGALTSDGDNYLVNTYNFERFTVIGSSANDRLNGRNNNDRLEGRDGNDALNAGAGDDYVDGGDGDDTIRAGAGKDTIEGGTGTDLLHYDRRDLSDGEVISLDLPSGAAFTLSDGSEVSGIEQIHLSLGGGENDVSLVANGDKNNSVNVASDTDIDHFAVDFSSFTEGVDWFHRGSSSSNQFAGALTSDGDNYLVNTYNFERFTVIGSSANDRLNGRNNNDRLEGRDGNDALNAGAGDDYVDGGDGDDTIRAGAGKDTIEGGTGTDLLHYDRRDLSDGEVISLDLPSGAAFTLSDGSEVSGIEQIHLSLGGGENDVSLVANGDKNNSVNVASDTDIDHFAVDFSSFTEGVDWFHRGSSSSNQFAGALTSDGDNYLVNTYNFERFTVIGSSANDRLNGRNNNDRLEGRDGNDALNAGAGDDYVDGGDGDDTIRAGSGNDRVYSGSGTDVVYLGDGNDYVKVGGGFEEFHGGSGKDYISYYDSTGGVTINLATNEVSGSWASNDTISGFESVSGSKTGGDKIYGTSGSNTIKTYGGNDKVYAGKGSDKVYLGDGNDYVKVGGGVEEFHGGAGKDYLSYYDSTGGITVNLAANEISGSWAVNDTISGFESFSGSKTGGDHVTGTSGSNTIKTYGGNDKVYAGKGTDKVELGSGNDYVRVGGGKENFDGGTGTDYISYYDSTGGIRIDLEKDEVSGSWAVNDTIKDFESASGSKTGADTMLGTSGANTLKGFGGDDKLYGRSGNDKLYGGDGKDRFDGGAGTDYLYGGADADVFHFDFSEDHDIIKDFENNVDTIELDNFSFAPGEDAFDFATQVGSDVVFDFGGGDMLTVENATIGQLYNDLEIV